MGNALDVELQDDETVEEIRLVTELKEKANAWTLGMGTVPGGTRVAAASGLTIRPMDTLSEAVAALTGLQFKPSEAQGAVAAASR